MKRSIQLHVMGVVLLGAFSATSQAVVLNPGDTLALPGTTVAAQPNLAGLIVEDALTAFSFAANGGTISGTVQNRVVQAIDGTYDFYWRVFNDANSSGAIQSFRFGDFFTSVYDANYRIDGLGDVAPTTAQRFTGAFDSFVNFNFGDLLAAGVSSNFFFMDTDATSYSQTAFYDLANVGHTEISGPYAMFAPAKVPEPATALLLGAGMLGVFLRRRKQTK